MYFLVLELQLVKTLLKSGEIYNDGLIESFHNTQLQLHAYMNTYLIFRFNLASRVH